MQFSWATHGLYLASAALEGALLFSFRSRPETIVKTLRVYLIVALVNFAVLFPLSLWQCGSVYFVAYIASSYLTVASELIVLYGVFRELQGRASGMGSFREWLTAAMFICVLTIGSVLLEASYLQSPIARFWAASDQALAHLRNLTMMAIVLYSAISACTWSRAASLTWLGMSIYSLGDFISQRLNISQEFHYQSLVRFVPFASGLLMFAFWKLAAIPPKQVLVTAEDRQVVATLRQISRLRWQRNPQ